MTSWIQRLEFRESGESLAEKACAWLQYLPRRCPNTAQINAVLMCHRDAIAGGFFGILMEEMPPPLCNLPQSQLLRIVDKREQSGKATVECVKDLRAVLGLAGNSDALVRVVSLAYLFREYALSGLFDHISDSIGLLFGAAAKIPFRGQDFCAFGMLYAAIGLPLGYEGPAESIRLTHAADALRHWSEEAVHSQACSLEWNVMAHDLAEVHMRWRAQDTAPLPLSSEIIADIERRAGLVKS